MVKSGPATGGTVIAISTAKIGARLLQSVAVFSGIEGEWSNDELTMPELQ
jgi:hypothetical protein